MINQDVPDNSSFNLLKQQLLDTEAKIKSMVGDSPDCLKSEAFSTPDNLETIRDLLSGRCYLLNQMFLGTQNEMDHLKKVNNHFLKLWANLQKRESALLRVEKDPSFDDDCMIEGTIRIPYNDATSVLDLEEDCMYGSDFRLMASVLYKYYYTTGREYLDILTDDGIANIRKPFNGEMFDEICVSYALQDLCYRKDYSIPDIIRLNDFWAEAKFVVQSITTQTGERINLYD